MGKRKSSSKPQGPKKREPLATSFQCLFCNHENAVTVKLDKKSSTGDLSCKVCGQTFQTGINYLSQAVDVYSDWVDACDAVAKDAADSTAKSNRDLYRDPNVPSRSQAERDDGATAEDDGFIDDDDAEADYGDE
ncbi:hypothetical protein MBLNU459_g5474t1 [Dothideomycetes sp. NU459]